MNLFARSAQPASITADIFYILDFDRCLGRTDAFQALLEEVLENWPVVDLEMVRYAHREVKKTGGHLIMHILYARH